jgi:hypothetical protein
MIRSLNGGTTTVRYGDKTRDISLKPGEFVTLDGVVQQINHKP